MFDRADYSVAVKRTPKSQNFWRWEISRAGRSSSIEQSSANFDTMAAATRAGKEALKQFLDKYDAVVQVEPERMPGAGGRRESPVR
jgi:hypothetical protein